MSTNTPSCARNLPVVTTMQHDKVVYISLVKPLNENYRTTQSHSLPILPKKGDALIYRHVSRDGHDQKSSQDTSNESCA